MYSNTSKDKNKIVPLKRYGQNFLQDKNIIKKIAAAINPLPGEHIIEIGPGEGALTAELMLSEANLKVVEIDVRCVSELQQKYPHLTIIQQDILKTDLAQQFTETGTVNKVVGNIPYNISSPIFFKLLEYPGIIHESVFMIQLEVAQRMIAQPRTKDYGILAVVFQTFAAPQILFKVSPEVFYPKPKVWSAVIRLQFNKAIEGIPDRKLYIQTVKACFGNRRKTLRNSLKNSVFGTIDFEAGPVDLQKRAEELLLPDFIALTNYIADKQRGLNV